MHLQLARQWRGQEQSLMLPPLMVRAVRMFDALLQAPAGAPRKDDVPRHRSEAVPTTMSHSMLPLRVSSCVCCG
jgi:hypothetical protein